MWDEYQKEVSEVQMEGFWGMAPYQIIMELDDDKLEQFAERAVANRAQRTQASLA
jgi:hypothetical protein